MLDYRPNGMSMWDTWYLVHEGKVHAYYLQRQSPESDRAPGEEDWLGHAVSDDLVRWTELRLALGPGEPGSLDELQPWTGCAVEHDGKAYLYYTMRSRPVNGMAQHTGAALSDDLVHWERYPGNPVISPDPRWYISHESPLPGGIVDCRDLIVVEDPDGNGWLGFYAARIPAEEGSETSVVAAVRSDDLLHWTHLPPAFGPRKYACLEVPDVFPLNGRWYLTCLTGHRYGNRGIFSDPHVFQGTIYAVADRLEGPYKEIEGDNTLIAGDGLSGYSCRSVLFEGERYVIYTQPSDKGPTNDSTLSPPMRLRTTADGRLRAAYSPRSQVWRQSTLLDGTELPPINKLVQTTPWWPLTNGRWELKDGAYVGSARTGWQSADLGIGAADIEIEAEVTIESGVACGIVLRPNSELAWPGPDIVFALDAEAQTVFSASLQEYADIRQRTCPIERGRPYHLRVCIRRPRVEIYVDGDLLLQFAMTFPDSPAPTIGLFVDRGVGTVRGLAAYALG